MDVYLDAVLHPRCINDEHTFAQEGWHYELEDPKVSGMMEHPSIPCILTAVHAINNQARHHAEKASAYARSLNLIIPDLHLVSPSGLLCSNPDASTWRLGFHYFLGVSLQSEDLTDCNALSHSQPSALFTPHWPLNYAAHG